MAADNPAPLCRCGFPNHLPEIRSTRFYNPAIDEWSVVRVPQPHYPDHPCCYYWMVDKGERTCKGCETSRAAERNRKARV